MKTISTGLAVVCLFLGLAGSGCGSNTTNGGTTATGGTTVAGGGATATGGTTASPGGTTAGTTATGGTTATLSAAALGQKYKFSATDIPGWQLNPDDPQAFEVLDESTPNNLVTFMDGGADAYTNAGCRVTVSQNLLGPNGEIVGPFYSMDFVTDAQATAMFNSKKADYSASDLIPGFDGSVAIGHSVIIEGTLISVNVFAHFKAMYFEMTLSGFADQTSFFQGAAQLLTVLKAKTN